MKKTAGRKKQLESLFRDLLSHFPLYSSHQEVCVSVGRDQLYVRYSTGNIYVNNQCTRVDVIVKDGVGDIIQLTIEPTRRRQGHGRLLVECVEAFCRREGCTSMQTTPSGQGIDFWPKVGYNETCSVGLLKRF